MTRSYYWLPNHGIKLAARPTAKFPRLARLQLIPDVGEMKMMNQTGNAVLRSPLFWLDVSAFLILIGVSCGWAPHCRTLYADFWNSHCSAFTRATLSVHPVVWSITFSIALALFVFIQVTAGDVGRARRSRWITLFVEVVLLVAFAWAIFSPLERMH